mgnify:CR=1 FL=1
MNEVCLLARDGEAAEHLEVVDGRAPRRRDRRAGSGEDGGGARGEVPHGGRQAASLGVAGCVPRPCAREEAEQALMKRADEALYEAKLTDRDFVAFEAAFSSVSKPTLNYFMRPVQVFIQFSLGCM